MFDVPLIQEIALTDENYGDLYVLSRNIRHFFQSPLLRFRQFYVPDNYTAIIYICRHPFAGGVEGEIGAFFASPRR